MYLNQPPQKLTLKDLLRKCYRKIQALFGQTDFVPSGHFYSPIANNKEIEEGIANISYDPLCLYGIDLRLDSQLELLKAFGTLYQEMPFSEEPTNNLRYYFNNQAYCHSDGICLYSMLRLIQPKRIIEVGSGFSSALMYDVNELFFAANSLGGGGNTNLEAQTKQESSITITHIEPHPALLKSLLKPGDLACLNLIPKRLQEVDIDLFKTLDSGDILFIDSTHVSKINSDVNRIFFEILPTLKKGVYIHFHDIFYPFSYPAQWLRAKNSWNEAYLLRAFLSYNTNFRIVFFNTALNYLYPELFATTLPLSQKNTGGSIWLEKIC